MRYHAKVLTVAAVVVAAVVGAALFVSAEEAGGGKTRILLVQGGGHDWKAHFQILADLLAKTGDFEVAQTEDLDDLKADRIGKYNVVLFYGSGQDFANAEQEKGLCDFVRGGGAYAGIHSATDSFKKSDAYWELVGGRFAGHGGGKFPVVIHDKDHPITAPLEDFEIQDETYSHNYHKNLIMRSLIHMNRGDERQSMGWVRPYGKGRMFYTSLGHGREAWTNPHFQRLVVRGLYWAAGREPKDPKP